MERLGVLLNSLVEDQGSRILGSTAPESALLTTRVHGFTLHYTPSNGSLSVFICNKEITVPTSLYSLEVTGIIHLKAGTLHVRSV